LPDRLQLRYNFFVLSLIFLPSSSLRPLQDLINRPVLVLTGRWSKSGGIGPLYLRLSKRDGGAFSLPLRGTLSPQYVVDQGTSRPLCSELVAQLKTSIMLLRGGNRLTRDLCSTLVPCVSLLYSAAAPLAHRLVHFPPLSSKNICSFMHSRNSLIKSFPLPSFYT
jgi:hypothetical protein